MKLDTFSRQDAVQFNHQQRPTAINEVIEQLKNRMFDELERTGGMYIPLYRDRGGPLNLRHAGGSEPANFPPELIRGE